MAEIASAYVTLLPSLRGQMGKVRAQSAKAGAQSGDAWSDAFKKNADGSPDVDSDAGKSRSAGSLAGKVWSAAFRKSAEADPDVESNSGQAGAAGALAGKAWSRGFKGAADAGNSKFMTGFVSSFGAIAAQLTIAGTSIGALAVPAATAVAALAPLAGSLLALPAVAFGAAGATNALKLGMSGFSDALKNMGDPKKFAKALAELSPNARAAALAVKDVAGEWRGMRDTVQDNLFQGVAAQVKPFSQAVLPELTKGLGAWATAWNKVATSAMSAITEQAKAGRIAPVLAAGSASMGRMSAAVGPLVRGILNLANAGAQLGGGFAGSVNRASMAFERWTQRITTDGSFQRWASGAATAFRQLGGIFLQTGRIIAGVFVAIKNAGTGAGLGVFEANLRAIADVVNGPAFQTGLTSFFQGTSAGMAGLRLALPAVGGLLAQLGQTIGVLASSFGPILGVALGAAATGLTRLLQIVTPLIPKIAAGLSPAVNALAPVLAPLAVVVGGLGLAFLKLAPVLTMVGGAFTRLGPLLARLFPTLSALVARFGASKVALAVLARAFTFLTGPVGIAIGVISALIPVLMHLWRTNEGFRGAVTAAWNAVKAAVSTAASFISGAVSRLVGSVRSANGPMAGIKGAWGGAFREAAATGKAALTALGAALAWIAGRLRAGATAVTPLVNALRASLGPAVRTAASALRTILGGALSFVGTTVRSLGQIVGGVFKTMRGVITGDWRTAWAGIKQIGSAGKAVVIAGVRLLWTTVKQLFRAGGAAIKAAWSLAWTGIKAAGRAGWSALKAAGSAGWSALKAGFSSGKAAIGRTWSSMWSSVKSTASSSWSAVKSTFSSGRSAITSTVESARSGITAKFQALGSRSKALTSSMWSGIKSTYSAGKSAASSTTEALRSAVTSKFSGLAERAKGIVRALWDAVKAQFRLGKEAVLAVVELLRTGSTAKFEALGSQVREKVRALWEAVKAAFRAGVDAVVAVAGELPGKVVAAVGDTGHLLVQAGKDAAAGFARGIKGAAGSVAGAAGGMASGALGAAQRVLDSHSPSREFAKLGKWSAEGFAIGLRKNTGTAVKSAQSLAADVTNFFARSPQNLLRRAGLRLSRAQQSALAGYLTREAAQIKRAGALRDRVAAQVQAAVEKRNALIKARNDFARGLRESLAGNPLEGVKAAKDLQWNLDAQLKKVRAFQRNMAILRKKGVHDALISKIAGMGLDGADQAAALARASKEQIKQINRSQSALAHAAKGVASGIADDLHGEGIAAANGLVAGLRSRQAAVEAAMLRMGQRMAAAVRRGMAGLSEGSLIRADKQIKAEERARKAAARRRATLARRARRAAEAARKRRQSRQRKLAEAARKRREAQRRKTTRRPAKRPARQRVTKGFVGVERGRRPVGPVRAHRATRVQRVQAAGVGAGGGVMTLAPADRELLMAVAGRPVSVQIDRRELARELQTTQRRYA